MRNPAAGVKTIETGREGSTPALTREQVQVMLGAIDRTTLQGRRDYALILLLVRTGIRREEAARVAMDDIQQQQGYWTLRVTRKGGGPQLVKAPADVYRALSDWLDAAGVREGALWRSLTRTGRGRAMVYLVGPALTTDGILKIVQQRARRGGIPVHISPHALRATFITLALDGGAPLHKVQYAAGHAGPRTTEQYHRTKRNLDDHASDYIRLRQDSVPNRR